MSADLELVRPDGRKIHGHHALPPTGAATTGAVVVLHEWWGLNAHVRDVAARFARAGFETIAPDLYHGEVARDAKDAERLMQALDGREAIEQDVRAAVQHLTSAGKKVATVGFCLGGALTIASAVHLGELSSAVCFYGIPPGERADPTRLKVELLGHFAERDGWVTPARVAALEAQLAASGTPFELHSYPADHAFFNDTRPEVYDATSAKLAWDRTLAFLTRTLAK